MRAKAWILRRLDDPSERYRSEFKGMAINLAREITERDDQDIAWELLSIEQDDEREHLQFILRFYYRGGTLRLSTSPV